VNSSLQTLDTLQTTRTRTALEEAQSHFDRAALAFDLDSATSQFLRSPMREHRIVVLVRMDNGTTKLFEGIRVQHTDARGPFEQVLRDAAHFFAVDRVAQACRERGWV
jgi:glutamate dehydrogenase/leucine dehydrogenase